MPRSVPRPRRAVLAAVVLAIVLVSAGLAGCAADVGHPADPPTAGVPAGERTVVEHVMEGVVVVVTVVRAYGDASATMHVVADDEAGPGTLVAEERVVGTDHYVRLRAARAVLGADVWIRFDLTDDRHRSHLAAHPVGLVDQAELSGSPADGLRVRRTALADAAPIEAPSAPDVVSFDQLPELPDLGLPYGR